MAALATLSFVAEQVDVRSYPADVREQVEFGVKYEGYVERQASQLAVFERLEAIALDVTLDYAAVPGLSREVVQKLTQFRPDSLGQASRISGITPAAISILAAHMRGRQPPRQRAS
jgi:tRNA uridine 5-carboxymethylaminomethyl modification enzyme